MPSKLASYFTASAAALLTALATALFLSNIANLELTPPHDPLLAIPMDVFFWILGIGAMAIVLACIFIRQPRFKLMLVFWFATNVILYGLGLQWQGMNNTSGYLGGLAHTFNLSDIFTKILLSLLFAYLFTGSAVLLVWNFLARPAEDQLKATCVHCGGHIAFPACNLNQKALCPHCQKETTLRSPDLLKMACFFCKEHIEFSTHAIGEKIPCPHCKMHITLKEAV